MSFLDDLRRVVHTDRRQLIGGSFRGVPFFVEERSRSGGRRLVTHEFPFRDSPKYDDLGRKARIWTITAYVIGDDIAAQKEALLSALEDQSGPGELIEPYSRANVRALCESVNLRESISEGGIARFSMTFLEAPAAVTSPELAPDLIAEALASTTTARLALTAEIVGAYSVDGQPGYATESLSADVVGVAEALGQALAPIVTTTQELALLDTQIRILVDGAISLILDPIAVLGAFNQVLTSLVETALAVPRDMSLALLFASDVAPPALAIGETPAREQERANQAALAEGIRQLLVVAAAGLLATVVYTTVEDALADRDAVVERIDAQLAVTGDEAFAGLLQLRGDILRAVPTADLARVITVTRRAAVTSLVLAHELYGSVDSEPDIVARNPTQQHPGFLAGEIAVLSSV